MEMSSEAFTISSFRTHDNQCQSSHYEFDADYSPTIEFRLTPMLLKECITLWYPSKIHIFLVPGSSHLLKYLYYTGHDIHKPVNDIHVSAPARQINRMRTGRYSLSLCHFAYHFPPNYGLTYLLSRPYLTPETLMKGALLKFSKEELLFSAIGSILCSSQS